MIILKLFELVPFLENVIHCIKMLCGNFREENKPEHGVQGSGYGATVISYHGCFQPLDPATVVTISWIQRLKATVVWYHSCTIVLSNVQSIYIHLQWFHMLTKVLYRYTFPRNSLEMLHDNNYQFMIIIITTTTKII